MPVSYCTQFLLSCNHCDEHRRFMFTFYYRNRNWRWSLHFDITSRLYTAFRVLFASYIAVKLDKNTHSHQMWLIYSSIWFICTSHILQWIKLERTSFTTKSHICSINVIEMWMVCWFQIVHKKTLSDETFFLYFEMRTHNRLYTRRAVDSFAHSTILVLNLSRRLEITFSAADVVIAATVHFSCIWNYSSFLSYRFSLHFDVSFFSFSFLFFLFRFFWFQIVCWFRRTFVCMLTITCV